MSEEIISIEEVIAYSLTTFPGLIEGWNWGERSLSHERRGPAYPFLSVVERIHSRHHLHQRTELLIMK
jgi:hypothetical protein